MLKRTNYINAAFSMVYDNKVSSRAGSDIIFRMISTKFASLWFQLLGFGHGFPRLDALMYVFHVQL